jgi:predicted HicB family RNase H-like nuclease
MTGDQGLEYNYRAIRELLLAAYSADELRALIAYDDELRRLRHEFSPNDAIIDIADKTIEYCNRRLLMDYFLSLVEEDRPRPYAHFEGRLRQNRGGG